MFAIVQIIACIKNILIVSVWTYPGISQPDFIKVSRCLHQLFQFFFKQIWFVYIIYSRYLVGSSKDLIQEVCKFHTDYCQLYLNHIIDWANSMEPSYSEDDSNFYSWRYALFYNHVYITGRFCHVCMIVLVVEILPDKLKVFFNKLFLTLNFYLLMIYTSGPEM